MPYQQYKPSEALSNYIESYWIRKTPPGPGQPGRRVYADGCSDIIVNTGSTTAWYYPMAHAGDIIPMLPGHMYLGGTMTVYGVVTAPEGCILTGIRFLAGGFYSLYGQPMAPAVDSLLEFSDPSLQSLMEKANNPDPDPASRLNTYFSARKIITRRDFSVIYKMILASKGQITVEALSKDCHMSNRTMERVFKENVGIAPKELIQIVRFQEVLRRLRQLDVQPAARQESLLRIAFGLGYHDHAHLTNEFKKYAGILPSELSRFYKTGMALGQYF
jgi:AraC-like DNA-binding protein